MLAYRSIDFAIKIMNARCLFPVEYWAEMMRAIRNNCEEGVKSALEYCDPHYNNNQALYVAVHLGNPVIVTLLLTKITQADWGNLLFDACSQNHVDVTDLLLTHGVYKETDFQSALCIAIHSHSIQAVECLCPHLSQNGMGWGLIWAGDTWPPSDPIYDPLLLHIHGHPFATLDFSAHPFSPHRRAEIEKNVEQACARFSKKNITEQILGDVALKTRENRRI